MPETKMDEKQAQQQPPAPAAPAAGKGDTFRLVARGVVVVLGLSWAGTLAFLLSQAKWLGSPSVPLGHSRLSPAALAVGLAFGAAIVFLVMKKLGAQLSWARPGLGRAVRLFSFIFIGALIAFGAYALYMAPSISSVWWQPMAGPWSMMGKSISLKPILFPAVAVFLTMMSVTYLILNREKSADFLIETEGEIKKVSWPARKEYMGSAAIVVLVVAIVSMFLHYVDLGLSKLMQFWGVGF
jgi:preprotein translocase SecE subunit